MSTKARTRSVLPINLNSLLNERERNDGQQHNPTKPKKEAGTGRGVEEMGLKKGYNHNSTAPKNCRYQVPKPRTRYSKEEDEWKGESRRLDGLNGSPAGRVISQTLPHENAGWDGLNLLTV